MIYMTKYITDMPYITSQYKFWVDLKDQKSRLAIKLNDLDLYTHGVSDIFMKWSAICF